MRKVLIVEDEEAARRGLVLGVDWTALDCEVVGEAGGGEEALEAVEKCAPTLIITDLNMPGMGGLEMLRRLREQGNWADVIILTVSDSFSNVQSALRLGAADYLLKPLREDELEQAVANLSRQPAARRRRARPAEFPGMKQGTRSRYVLDAMAYMEENYGEQGIGVGTVARYLGISEGHLSHIFKRETDCTPLNYLTRCRIQRAMELLRDSRLKVYEVAERVGYRDITYFSATFKKLVGVSPSEYQDSCR